MGRPPGPFRPRARPLTRTRPGRAPARTRSGRAPARRAVFAAALAAVLAAGTGCTVPTAGGAAPHGSGARGAKKVSDLRIAYFSAGTSNSYLQAAIAEAHRKAARLGVRLDVFDGEFDAQKQFDQIQTALSSGRYNAFAVEPNDGNLVCNVLTRSAPAKHIAVSVFNLPICGRATKTGKGTWQPGTAAYVGGQTLDVYEKWVRQVIGDHPKGAEVALITGPDLNANTICFEKAAEEFARHKGFRVVARQSTDYTTPKGMSAAQTILRSHPGLDVVMSNFSGMSRGVVQAVDGSGRKGKVDVYDFGGDRWALRSIGRGDLEQSVMMLPGQETDEAIQALADRADGRKAPHFVDLTDSPQLPGTPFASRENAGRFTPEY